MKVLIVVTHLLGVGHLARAAALGRALTRAGHGVTLASGGRPAPNVPLSGLTLVQLPEIHAKGTDFRTLYDDSGAVASEAYMAGRREKLVAALHQTQPDAVIVELFPFGRRQIAREFTELLEELEMHYPDSVVFSSVRDVLAPPSNSKKALEAFDRLGRYFDGVLVHGDAAVLPLEASWPVTRELARRLTYTGYVRDSEAAENAGDDFPSGEVLVSGGGSAASLPLMRAALGAARAQPDRRWRLLVGHGVPQPDFDALVAAAPENAAVERARRDFDTLLRRAACSVSQAGYNTMLDLAAAGVPSVVVPFAAGQEVEQTIRATRFAAMGLCEVVSEEALSVEALAAAVNRALTASADKMSGKLLMDGAQQTVAVIEQAVAEKQATAAAWRRVEAALDETSRRGRTFDLWWRDDDAVQPTPALDRLLALAGKIRAPLALAVIPEQATAALAARLAGNRDVAILVHGVAHRNNAAAGAKKQELVDGLASLPGDLARAREKLETLFGRQALPILVPPWNRISAALTGQLGALGFAGLSTFGPEEKMPVPAGLAVVNTHLDPIDWKGGGGLVCASAHITALAVLIEQRLVDNRPVAGPAGFLTHHLVHDPWIWRFVETLLMRLVRHHAVRFVGAEASFGLT